ncbi:DUF2384 domain-containing protein [Massilia sp. Dwa41.01b]|nr:DUF2384 domain-containing protein [Massilia sp. Dwa41.01b]QNB01308.1 DUF2384 domain-containing protein [Massilia sp. Se16.2.3]
MDALRARFEAQSRKAQAYYTVMHAARGVLGSDDAADAWMNAPLAPLGGQTPAVLVNEGRTQELLEHVGKLKPGAR